MRFTKLGVPMMKSVPVTMSCLLLVALLFPALIAAAPIQTDSSVLGAQTLRAHWHVFIAYALAWVFVFGWLFSVARRLTRVEQDLQR